MRQKLIEYQFFGFSSSFKKPLGQKGEMDVCELVINTFLTNEGRGKIFVAQTTLPSYLVRALNQFWKIIFLQGSVTLKLYLLDTYKLRHHLQHYPLFFKVLKVWADVTTQLVEQWLSTPVIRSSNPIIGNFYFL